MAFELKPGEDLHCSLDKKSTQEWLSDHTRDDDRPYDLWIHEFDRLLYERRQRTTYAVTGGMQFDTKRLILGYEGKNCVARKIEFVTHRAFGTEPENEHPEESHEWHTYYLVFDEEDFILGMVIRNPAHTPMAWSDAMKIQENYKALTQQPELIRK